MSIAHAHADAPGDSASLPDSLENRTDDERRTDSAGGQDDYWATPPGSTEEAVARVARTLEWIRDWRALAEQIVSAATAEPLDARALKRAKMESELCLRQWCPSACGWHLWGRDRGQAMQQYLGTRLESVVQSLQAAERLWPHEHPWAPGESHSRWPSDPGDVAALAKDIVAALDRACQHGALLVLAFRVRQRRVGERTDVAMALREWDLPEENARPMVQWMVADPPRFGDEQVPLVVDTESRSIYRAAANLWERVYTTTAWLWGSALGFGLLLAFFGLLDAAALASWPEDGLLKFLVLYLFVIGGALLHIASMQLSAIRFDDPLQIYAASTGFAWLGLRWLAVLRLLIPVVIVAGSLWAAGTVPTNFQDLGVALLSGYSADSLFRASISRVQSQARS